MTHSPFDAGDLETLDRLCEKGEMLWTERFTSLTTLMKKGYAKKVSIWVSAPEEVWLVKPTDAGRNIAEIRMRWKLKGEGNDQAS